MPNEAILLSFMSICQWKASASFSKNTCYDKASGSVFFLIFDQISGSCFYKIVLIKESVLAYKFRVQSSIFIIFKFS